MTTIVDEFNAQNSTFNTVGRDQNINNTYYNHFHAESSTAVASSSRGQPPLSIPSFNDAPVDLLSMHFTGRRTELTLMARAFGRPRSNIPLRCVLFGDQGVGKSQLTYEWSRSTFVQGANTYVIWMSATSVEKLDQGFSKILHLINHPDPSHADQVLRLTTARRWLEEIDSGNWLLVLDNVCPEVLGFLREHLPRKNGRGSILFTTRTKDVAIALANAAGTQHYVVRVPMLSVEEGVELFLGHFRGSDIDVSSAQAEEIVKSVGCLPLAISHAAAYMKQSRSGIDELLALYRGKDRINAISWQNSLSDYEHQSVAATFENQLEELERNYPDASNLLKVLAYLDPESIPLDMLISGATATLKSKQQSSPTPVPSGPHSVIHKITDKVLHWGGNKGKGRIDEATSLLVIIQSRDVLRNAITILQAQCLTAYEDSSHLTLRIHDLTRLIVLEKMKKGHTHQQWFECAVELAFNAFEQIEDPALPASWRQCEMLIPHIQSLTTRQEISAKAQGQLLDVNSNFSWYLRSRGRYGEAEELCLRVLTDKEQIFGSQDLRTLDAMYTLAVVYEEQGHSRKAETLLRQVLRIDQQKLGPEHPRTLTTMYMLAIVYRSQGRDKVSEEVVDKVLKTRQKRLGSEHRDTLDAMHLLANIYNRQNRYSEAETLYKQLLQTMHDRLGEEHIETVRVMHNLALVYSSQRRHDDAEVLFKKVLRIWNKQLGSNHPQTILVKHNLASVFKSQGRYKEAEALLVHALARREEVLGRSHPDTQRTIDFLGTMYEKLGRSDDAEIVRRGTDRPR